LHFALWESGNRSFLYFSQKLPEFKGFYRGVDGAFSEKRIPEKDTFLAFLKKVLRSTPFSGYFRAEMTKLHSRVDLDLTNSDYPWLHHWILNMPDRRHNSGTANPAMNFRVPSESWNPETPKSGPWRERPVAAHVAKQPLTVRRDGGVYPGIQEGVHGGVYKGGCPPAVQKRAKNKN